MGRIITGFEIDFISQKINTVADCHIHNYLNIFRWYELTKCILTSASFIFGRYYYCNVAGTNI